MKSIYKYSLVLLLGLSSCEKSLDADIPVGKFVSSGVFQDKDLAEAAVRGIYASMVNFFVSVRPFQASLATTLSLSSDEYVLGAYNANQTLIFENNLAPEMDIVGSIWNAYYNSILQCNMIIENATGSTALAPDFQKSIIAEARFIRAFNFFYLTNIYGDVPMHLTSDYAQNALRATSAPADIYKQMIEDLLYAQDNLTGNSTTAGSRSRPSKWSATALLARVYLYQKNWAAAEQAASAVIGQSSIYQLETLDNVFLTTSREAIWALHNYSTNLYVPDASDVQGPVATNSAFRFSAFTLSRFDANDQRKVKWTKTLTTATGTTTAQYKFKTYANSPAGAKAEATMELRLAEQYLIRAEARAMQPGKLADAIKDVDVIRIRAGAVADNVGANAANTFKTIGFSTPAITSDELVKVIYDERIRELFGEFAHRWFDAKRATNDLKTFFENRKPLIAQTDAFFPVPKRELDFNKNIKQRNGY